MNYFTETKNISAFKTMIFFSFITVSTGKTIKEKYSMSANYLHGFNLLSFRPLIVCLSVTTQQLFKTSFTLTVHNGFIDFNGILLHVSTYERHHQTDIH
jgi:hypothetical protein